MARLFFCVAQNGHASFFVKSSLWNLLHQKLVYPIVNQISMYYIKACNKLVWLFSALFRLWATQLFVKKCRSSGELLATLCLIWLALNLNLALEMDTLPHYQLSA